MENRSYSAYDEAAQTYLASFRALRDAPPAPAHVTTRAAGDVDAEVLIQRADEIADVSASMVGLAQGYLEAPDLILREGISGQLLAQAAAELQVASELLKIAEHAKASRPRAITRATRGASLRTAVDAMERAMEFPVSGGLLPAVATRRAAVSVPPTVGTAKANLRHTASTSTGAIIQRVHEFGGDIAWSLVFQTQWGAVVDGVSLLRNDITEKLEAVKEGLGSLFARAVATAAKTLLNVYDKLLALLGKDAEDQARKKVKAWLDEVKEEGKIDLFDKLVDKLYRVDVFETDLDTWLVGTTADNAQIQEISDAVSAVSDKFIVLVGRMSLLANAINLAKLIKVPQVLAIVAGLQVMLLAVLIYSGFDYVGYKQPGFMNLTKGVAEVIQEGLLLQA